MLDVVESYLRTTAKTNIAKRLVCQTLEFQSAFNRFLLWCDFTQQCWGICITLYRDVEGEYKVSLQILLSYRTFLIRQTLFVRETVMALAAGSSNRCFPLNRFHMCDCVTYQPAHRRIRIAWGSLLKRSVIHRSQLISNYVLCEQTPRLCSGH